MTMTGTELERITSSASRILRQACTEERRRQILLGFWRDQDAAGQQQEAVRRAEGVTSRHSTIGAEGVTSRHSTIGD